MESQADTHALRPPALRFLGVFAAVWLIAAMTGCPRPAPDTRTVREPTTETPYGARPSPGPAATLPENVTRAGIDVLLQRGFSPLFDKRLGVMTNDAAVDANGRPTLDHLIASPHLNIVRVFTVFHGLDPSNPTAEPRSIRGRTETAPQIPVVNLTPETLAPPRETLQDLDLLIVDVQDLGVRFSPYVGALAAIMEECSIAGVPVLVLDRPNPLGGQLVAGPIQDSVLYGRPGSFYPMPIAHGMTVGELAQMYNDFYGVGVELEVVRLEGWSRTYRWPRTERPWAAPLPGLGDFERALAYVPLTMVEGGGLSLGEGTPRHMRVLGAPYLDAAGLAGALAALEGLEGWSFEAVRFTPESGRFAGETCQGLALGVVDPRTADPVELGLALLRELHQRHPGDFSLQGCYSAVGSRAVLQDISRGGTLPVIKKLYQGQLVGFQRERFRALIYER